MGRLPPLAAVRVFEAAARHESFTKAAVELGMTQSAVSYQMRLLEERLGTALFVRRGGRVVLSDTGRRLGPTLAQAFTLMENAFAEVADEAAGVLKLTIMQTFAVRFLVPRLDGFRRAHPDIGVEIDAEARLVDLVGEGYDAAVRSGFGDWPGVVAERLLPVEFTPLLSPRLLERVGPLAAPADLLRLPLISPREEWWPQWFAAAGVPGFAPARKPGVELRMQHLEGDLALAGEGAALMTPAMWREEMASGRLVQPFDVVATAGFYWLVEPEGRRRPPKVRAFRDWLLAEVARDAALYPAAGASAAGS